MRVASVDMEKIIYIAKKTTFPRSCLVCVANRSIQTDATGPVSGRISASEPTFTEILQISQSILNFGFKKTPLPGVFLEKIF